MLTVSEEQYCALSPPPLSFGRLSLTLQLPMDALREREEFAEWMWMWVGESYEWHWRCLSTCASHGCQMAKFDPFLSLDCARVEGVGRNPRKGRDQILQRSIAEP